MEFSRPPQVSLPREPQGVHIRQEMTLFRIHFAGSTRRGEESCVSLRVLHNKVYGQVH